MYPARYIKSKKWNKRNNNAFQLPAQAGNTAENYIPIVQLKYGTKYMNYFHTLDNRLHRNWFLRGKWGESYYTPGFLTGCNFQTTSLGTESKQCPTIFFTEKATIPVWESQMKRISGDFQRRGSYREKDFLKSKFKSLAELQSVNAWKSIARPLKARQRTTPDERTIRRNYKTNNYQSSYRVGIQISSSQREETSPNTPDI